MAFFLFCLANSCSFLFPHSDGTHKKLHGKWVLEGTEKTVVFLILCIETQSCHADKTNGKCTNLVNMSFDACWCLPCACGAGSIGVRWVVSPKECLGSRRPRLVRSFVLLTLTKQHGNTSPYTVMAALSQASAVNTYFHYPHSLNHTDPSFHRPP